MAYFKIENLSIHLYTVPASSFVQIGVQKKKKKGIRELGFLCPNEDIESEIHQWKIKTPFGYLLTTQPFEYFKNCFHDLGVTDSEEAAKQCEQQCIDFARKRFYSFLAHKNHHVVIDNR